MLCMEGNCYNAVLKSPFLHRPLSWLFFLHYLRSSAHIYRIYNASYTASFFNTSSPVEHLQDSSSVKKMLEYFTSAKSTIYKMVFHNLANVTSILHEGDRLKYRLVYIIEIFPPKIVRTIILEAKKYLRWETIFNSKPYNSFDFA